MRHRGFSFAEVMFAVVILGIGFVMVSAIFPIAAEQTRSTTDEAVAAHLARDAFKTIQLSTTLADYPTTEGVLRPFSDVSPDLWDKVSASSISPVDHRYAWVPFYSRNGAEDFVHISVMVVRRWNTETFTPDDFSGDLMPRGIDVLGVAPGPGGTRIIQIQRDPLRMYQSLAEGSLLLVRSGDGSPNLPGRVLQLGHLLAEDSETVSYNLVPGNGLSPDEQCNKASAAAIGRDLLDPSNPNGGYTGPSQDIAVYTTIIRPN